MAKSKTNYKTGKYKYFRTRLKIGEKSDGKPIMKTFYGNSKREAEMKKTNYLKLISYNTIDNRLNRYLGREIHDWLWEVKKISSISDSTFERNEGVYRNHIKGWNITKYKVKDIGEKELKQYIKDLLNSGRTRDTVSDALSLINMFYNYIYAKNPMLVNPVKLVNFRVKTASNVDEAKIKLEKADESAEIFSEEELKLMSKHLKENTLKYIVIFALLTGMRVGEILSLETSEIKENDIHVVSSVRRVKKFNAEDDYEYVTSVTNPKTESSIRKIPISKDLKNILPHIYKLKELKKEKSIEKYKLRGGIKYEENGLLFPTRNGTHIANNNLHRQWKKLLENSNVPHKNFHSLRKTYASTMVNKNETSIKTISRLLGHKNTLITEKYLKVENIDKVEAISSMNKISSIMIGK
jgi:integrase